MSYVLPPDVYAIAQGEVDDYRRYCYCVTAASGKNLLIGDPAYNEDLAEALDALGGIDSLIANDSSDTELWRYEFGCDVIGKAGKPGEERLSDDLLLLRGAAGLLLLYEQHGGALFCGDMLAIEAGERLSGDRQAATLLKQYAIAAILPSRVKGEFITEGGAKALTAIRPTHS